MSWRSLSVRALHRLAPLRRLAKRALRGVTLSQPYHGGRIYFDAVDHAWAWVGHTRYEGHDLDVQEALVRLAAGRRRFVDVGSNVGAMTLRVLLAHPELRARCFDANARALALLTRSAQANALADRVEAHRAVVAPEAGVVLFDDTLSVAGHVSTSGRAVPAVAFGDVLAEAADEGALVKLDIEGFEARLLPLLPELVAGPLRKRMRDVVLVVELHPRGMNGAGDPAACLAALRASGAAVTDLHGTALATLDEREWTNAVATW